ncbi:hypothetical protein ABT160_15315 [Streptomyces sp. NPDC001941]|uniref:hypothetical protein n=1 Tax=Streptomyces sp. NPDC001941 TaxID=3154659 RepID=UPI003333D284
MRTNWMFGGVYGTVLASALLAALQQDGARYTPYYDAAWILVTAVCAAAIHGYAHHMSTHVYDTAAHRWRQLALTLRDEWPVVVAVLPTVGLLALSGAAGWHGEPATTAGLMLNAALLAGWGTFAALRVGYQRRGAILVGAADAAVGLLIAVANAVIK